MWGYNVLSESVSKGKAMGGTGPERNAPLNIEKHTLKQIRTKKKKKELWIPDDLGTSTGARGTWIEPNEIWREISKTHGADSTCMS